MLTRKLLCVAVTAALAAIALPCAAAPSVTNRAVEIVGAGAASDPLIAVEANRSAIIDRLMAEHGATLAAAGVSADTFRTSLNSLRADQLLAASLVNSVEGIASIVADAPDNGSVLQRFVAVSPRDAASASELPGAQAYVVRDGDTVSIVPAAELQAGTQLVGYFTSATSTTIINGGNASSDITPKDGAGSGPNSWIGYLAGSNLATGTGSAVAAGTFNLASGPGAFVGAGTANQANGISSLVIGGFDNRAVAIDSLVGAGAGNRATGVRSVVVGGGYNLASGQWSFIGGGGRNGTARTPAGTSTLDNVAAGDFSVIGGGQGNRVSGSSYATVGGGHSNAASFSYATVGGGDSNAASFSYATVGGGYSNTASGVFATVGGGYSNTASGDFATVGGGHLNTASGAVSTAGGGLDNIAGGEAATVSGGQFNTANGLSATVSGGGNNQARGAYSWAGGFGAVTSNAANTVQHHGAFAWADAGPNFPSGTNFWTVGNNEFAVRATGGVRFVTAIDGGGNPTRTVAINGGGNVSFGSTTRQMLNLFNVEYGIGIQPVTSYSRVENSGNDGAGGWSWYKGGVHADVANDPGAGGVELMRLARNGNLTTAGTVNGSSDVNGKTAFTPVDAKALLARVANLPITSWQYRDDADHARHIGPTAQDFAAAFGVGTDDRHISMVDADGVALAAIQGLHQLVQEMQGTMQTKDAQIAALTAEMVELRRSVELLLARSSLDEQIAQR